MSGTRAVDRALTILHHFVATGPAGARLVDLTNATGLPHATVYRLVQVLQRHGLVRQDPLSKRLHAGPEIGLLASGLTRSMDAFLDKTSSHLSELQKETGEIAVLMVRSGYDMVLTHMKTGRRVLRVAGARRPLGVGSSGIAILARLDPRAAGKAIEANRVRFRSFANCDEGAVRDGVGIARIKGYASAHGVERAELSCVSMAVCDRDETPVAALTILSTEPRLSPDRTHKLVVALDAHRRKVQALLGPHS